MMKNKVVVLYEEEQDDLYRGYDYVEPEVVLDKEHLNLFKKGIQRINQNYDYYLKERVTTHGNPKINVLEEIIKISEKKYLFSNVEAGLTPLSIHEYSYQTIICNTILNNISTTKRNSFSKNDLIEIIQELNDISTEFYQDMRPEKRFSDNYLPASREQIKIVNEEFFRLYVGKIFEVFERTQVDQIKDDYEWNIIKWNIRSNAELYMDDFYDGSNYSGLIYLRKLELLKKLPETFKLQKVVENFELTSLKDEFRYQFAGFLGMLDESKAMKVIVNEYENNSFEEQYKSFPNNQKRLFDIESRKFLKDISNHNGIMFNLGN